MTRRTLLAWLVGVVAALLGRDSVRPWIVGSNPMEPVGSSISDGYSGRVTDPGTGAGVFNPNLDPAVAGIDPLTGSLAPTGTDMSFGSAIRRQMHTNVINGDFAVLPPGGVESLIDSDPASATYNPLPGWTWTPPSDGRTIAYLTPDAAFGSGYKLAVEYGLGAVGVGTMSQIVAVPISQGQQYRVLLSVYPGTSNGIRLRYQYLTNDAVTTIGSEIEGVASGSSELKLDAGLPPPTAAYIRLRIYVDTSLYIKPGGSLIGEVRCAFLPAEATVGLASLAGSVAVTTTQTAVRSAIIPANTLVVGSVYRIKMIATVTSSAANVVTTRCRIGPTTLTGAVAVSTAPAATTTASNDPFEVEVEITVRSIGATGTVIAHMRRIGGATQPFAATPYSVEGGTGTTTIDTTVANLIEMTLQTAAGTTTVTAQQCTIECVMAS